MIRIRPNDRMFIVASAVLLAALAARAAQAASTEEGCNAARHKAAAKYLSCQYKAQAKYDATQDLVGYQNAAARCRDGYGGQWARIETAFAGSETTCDQPRFVDNGETVTDNLTNLEWEKKTDDSSIHDVDNVYSWDVPGDADFTNADGTAFAVFLSDLNGGACFAERCDWRLPTREELQTIFVPLSQCAMQPCTDPAIGPAPTGSTWSSTPDLLFDVSAWAASGLPLVNRATKTQENPVRGVRGGL